MSVNPDSTGISSFNNPLPSTPTPINKELNGIKDFIEKNKTKLQHSEIAMQTIEGLGKLEANIQELEMPSLQNEVYKMTGLAIHAADNYPDVDQFRDTVKYAANLIRNIFKEAHNDREKIQFINRGLDSRGCFEARIEELMHFDKDRHSVLGLIKFEAQDFLENKGRIATLNELVEHLDGIDFFNLNKIDKQTFKNSDMVNLLRSMGLVEPEGMSMADRIHVAISVYEDYGSGLENFKNFLKKELSLTPEQFLNIDKDIDEYFKKFPENRKWL